MLSCKMPAPPTFLQGYLRVGLPFQLMQQYNWQAMMLSDVDVVWLQVSERVLLLAHYTSTEAAVFTHCPMMKTQN